MYLIRVLPDVRNIRAATFYVCAGCQFPAEMAVLIMLSIGYEAVVSAVIEECAWLKGSNINASDVIKAYGISCV
jgi:hypothetical protein